jgi:uncharacterized protein YjdB
LSQAAARHFRRSRRRALQIDYGEGFYPSYSVGSGFPLYAYVVDSFGAYRNVTDQTTWTSSNPAILGLAFSAPSSNFGAFAPGTAQIKAVYGGFVVSVATVTITPSPVLLPLAIVPRRGPTVVGQTVSVRALVQNQNSSSQDVTGTTTWTSSNPRVATITIGSTVTITAVAPGTTDIQATFAGLSNSFRFSVQPL